MTKSTQIPVFHRIISQHEICNVVFNERSHQHAICANKPFQKDEIIIHFSSRETLKEPSFLTVQLDFKKHILLQPDYLQYTNHSCEPNVFFDTTHLQLIALRDIQVGEELTVFYPSTEWEMAKPFHCDCGKQKCLHIIRGAIHVHPAILKEYRLNEFIIAQLKK